MTQYTGTPGIDSLTGGAGSDYLDGGAAADTMAGLAGDDVYIVDDAGDTVIENPNEGKDRINTTIGFALPANVEDLWLVGTADVSGTGNGLGNTLWGNAGVNTLTGLGGDDYLDGGANADTLVGGTGDDTYWVDNAGDLVVENAGEGNDTVIAALASYTLPANVENLQLKAGAGDISGNGNGLDNTLTGNEGANALSGGGGNDTIDGGAGADVMAGGTGDDSYRVDNAGDVVAENPGEGTDTLTSLLAGYVLPANVENLNLGYPASSTGNLNGSGNELANTLRGNAGANALDGAGGDDTLIGGDGSDTLTGGAGNDTFVVYTTDSGTDTITDLAVGDVIQACGVILSGSVTTGTGSALLSGEVQAFSAGGQTTLYIGTDATPGADMHIVLNGTYAASNFTLSGFDIRYDTNHAPMLAAAIPAQQAAEGSAFSFQLPAGTFTDADNEVLGYMAELFDLDWGSVALPAWLNFDAGTGAFSGTPAHGDIGTLMVLVTAIDPHGASAAGLFDLVVQPGAPADTTAPTVVITDNVGGVANGLVSYTLSFSEPVSGLAPDDFGIDHGSVVGVTGSGANYTVSVLPVANSEASLGLSLKAGAVSDAAGNPNAAASAAPQAVDTKAPVVTSFSPSQAPQGIAVASDIVFSFSESIQRGSGLLLLKNAAGTVIESFDAATSSQIAVNGSMLTVNPSSNLAYNCGYTLSLVVGSIKDLAGNANAATGSWDFRTVAATNHLPTGSVTISGTAEQGQTLSASHTLVDADGLGMVSYQWRADGADIPGATGGTLLLGQALVGRTISVQARYTDGQQTLEGVDSAATLAVANVNDAPVAQAVSASGAEDAAVILVAPVASDVDFGDTLHYAVGGQPAHGSVSFNAASGRFEYRPAPDFHGSDTFSYQVIDAAGASATAMATIMVSSVNDAPVATGGSAACVEDTVLQARLPVATDADGDALSYSRVVNASHGSVQVHADGSYTYTPGANYNGPDSFSYRVSDGSTTSNTATVSLTVGAVNDAPTGQVSIAGEARQGDTLTASNTLADADGLGSISYQWQSDGHDIPGATGSSHLLDIADVGHHLRVVARYTDLGGNTEQVVSLAAMVSAAPNQSLSGSGSNDTLSGGAGNDRLAGHGGNDVIDGGSGTDTAVVDSPLQGVTSYGIDHGVLSLTTAAGTQMLSHIERLQFNDTLLALDTNAPSDGHAGGHAWQAAALWQAAFGALPDSSALGQWTAEADGCASMGQLGQRFIDHFAPGIGNEALVAYLYQQLMHQAPAADVVAALAGQIGEGHAYATQGELLAYAACLPENTDHLAGFTGSIQALDASWF